MRAEGEANPVLATQRPAELDPTIISQCSTLFVMRMANDRDHALVRSAVSDVAANLLSFVLPSLGTREVFAFGEGVAVPARLIFTEPLPHLLPKSEALGIARHDHGGIGPEFIAAVVERWRGAMMNQKLPAHSMSRCRVSNAYRQRPLPGRKPTASRF